MDCPSAPFRPNHRQFNAGDTSTILSPIPARCDGTGLRLRREMGFPIPTPGGFWKPSARRIPSNGGCSAACHRSAIGNTLKGHRGIPPRPASTRTLRSHRPLAARCERSGNLLLPEKLPPIGWQRLSDSPPSLHQLDTTQSARRDRCRHPRWGSSRGLVSLDQSRSRGCVGRGCGCRREYESCHRCGER